MTKMTRTKVVILAVSAMLALQSEAAPRTKAQMQAIAAKVINQHHAAKKMAPRTGALKVLRDAENYQILGYDEGGFAVVSADDLVPEVLGVSTSTYSQGENANFQWWLNAMNAAVGYAVQHNTPLKTTVPDPAKYPTEVDPLLTTKWYQTAPYSNMCPTYSGSVKCLTGCVATAMAQILNYHQTPEHGYGQRTIYYGGQAVTANFEEDYYDWANMLDRYDGDYTQQEADAVALLMRDCGVAADMEYGGPDEGSGAYSTEAARGLRTYFGFEDAQCLERDYYSEAQWMDIVYRELSENGPLYYGGVDYLQGGHAFVLDGYRANGMVCVNWGWAGNDDGDYNIALLNPPGCTFSYGQDMIIGVKSNNHSLMRSESVVVETAGTLQQTVEALEGEGEIGSLAVTGMLNEADLLYLRHLAGRDTDGAETDGKLRTLNLANATLPDGTLPAGAFKDCQSLRRVVLPESVIRFGAEAFSGCKGLSELRIRARQVPTLDGTAVFRNVPFGSANLYVRSGLRGKFLQKAQWNSFGEDHIMEFGISVKVRNMIRKYGQENPTFLYTVTGTVEGKPALTCEATPTSPAGRYDIHISRGTIEGNDEIDFIDGYLIVQKIDATATVGSYTRSKGQANPEFGFVSYEGLIESDLTPVWLTEPTFVCEADEQSPEGEYPITVSQAVAESYEMTFVPGVLSVTETTGITDVQASVPSSAPVFTLDGVRLQRKPARGLYVQGGKLRVATR